MPDKRIALVTGANQGVGLQVAKELVANGVTVLVGARRSEERRVGKECTIQCRSRWSPYH